MLGRGGLIVRRIVAALLVVALAMPVIGATATATETRRPDETAAAKTAAGEIVVAQLFEEPFFRRLFGGDEPPPRQPSGPKVFRLPSPEKAAPATRNRRPDRERQPERAAPKRIKVPKPEVVRDPKDPDAKRVLVVGDTFAQSLANGLDVAFADTPGVRIVDASNEAAGLTDTGSYDVAARIREEIQGETPADAVVVMLGFNDRSPIEVGGNPVGFRTEPWETMYRARVRAVISAAREAQIPVYWVGLMPTSDLEVTTDVAYLDEIYRQEAAPLYAVYVDVWNAFTDEFGGVLRSGPDVTGQVRQLRLKNGVGFTKSGSRKLAFYVEQEIRSWLERGAPGTVLPQVPGSGLVLSLNDPEAGPEDDLAGATGAAAPEAGTPLYDLVVLGKPLQPRAGRVDDLRSTR